MRAKLDENVPIEAADLLRAADWECDTVYEEGLTGAGDPEVAAACQTGARVLFTLDLDFADIRAYPPKRVRRHCRAAPGRTQSATSAGVGEPRPSGLVR
jgi:predicted nuclease of predicted toxin-antitoxin system